MFQHVKKRLYESFTIIKCFWWILKQSFFKKVGAGAFDFCLKCDTFFKVRASLFVDTPYKCIYLLGILFRLTLNVK